MILKILVLAALVAGALFLFKNKNKKDVLDDKGNDETALDMKRDVICGSYVEETTGYKVRLYDKVYYFCSEDCKNKFIENNTK